MTYLPQIMTANSSRSHIVRSRDLQLATNSRDNGRVYTVNLLPEQATQEENW